MQGLSEHTRRVRRNAKSISERNETNIRIEVLLRPTENRARIVAKAFKPNINGRSRAEKANKFAEMMLNRLTRRMTHFSHSNEILCRL